MPLYFFNSSSRTIDNSTMMRSRSNLILIRVFREKTLRLCPIFPNLRIQASGTAEINRIQKFPLLKRSHPPLPSTPPRRIRGVRKSVWNTITRMTRYSLPPIPIRKRGACCSFGAEIHSIWLKAGADRLGRGSAPSPL